MSEQRRPLDAVFVEHYVRASRRAQGLPDHVEDAEPFERCAAILAAASEKREAAE
ncbi:MAG: hypothetical protein M3O91_01495 [Chloroflexota bacterium]|nr:hypothetical protein [Chloroflexota bacterium]